MAQIVKIGNFNQGGLSDSKLSGIPNSAYKLTGIDIHSNPGSIKAMPSLVKISGSTITEFCRESVVLSNGDILFFSSTSGKIWNIDTTNTVTLVYTTSAAAGGSGCLGAAYHEGYIYWATESRLHRVICPSSPTWGSASPNWQTFTCTDNISHPMISHSGLQVLYIGDGRYIAQVDNGVFSATALDIRSPLRIRAIGEYDTDVIFGTWVSDTTYSANFFRWNGWSISYTNSCFIEETGVNSIFRLGNLTLAQIGMNGNIYSYNGATLELWKKIPGTYDSTNRWYMHSNSVANINGKILLAPSYVYGTAVDQGIYQIAKYDNKYPEVIDMPYVISERSSDAFVLSGIEIGAIAVSGYNIYVAWKNGSVYGVDKLNYSLPLNGAYLESRVAMPDRGKKGISREINVPYIQLPTNTSIGIATSVNYNSYIAQTVVTDTDRRIAMVTKDYSEEFNTIQVKLTLNTSGATTPEVEYIDLISE